MPSVFLCKIYGNFISIKWTQTGKISIINIAFADKIEEFSYWEGTKKEKGRYIL